MKECSRCRRTKPLIDFFESSSIRHKGKHASRCKLCSLLTTAEYKAKCKDSTRKADLVRKYNITVEQFEQKSLMQEGKCAICFKVPDRRLDVDHNHETGKFRGLLCNNCNRTLGQFGDTPEKFLRAYTYLKENH